MNKLKQAIIEKIHGLPWEEAAQIEMMSSDCQMRHVNNSPLPYCEVKGLPITLSRVLQALAETFYDVECIVDLDQDVTCMNLKISGYLNFPGAGSISKTFFSGRLKWKLLKKDKSTATLEDQSEETIEALTKIFL